MAVILASVPQEGGPSLGSDGAPIPYHPAPLGLLDRLGGVFPWEGETWKGEKALPAAWTHHPASPVFPHGQGFPGG